MLQTTFYIETLSSFLSFSLSSDGQDKQI